MAVDKFAIAVHKHYRQNKQCRAGYLLVLRSLSLLSQVEMSPAPTRTAAPAFVDPRNSVGYVD
jgi:hypothetical protein